jgi:hypothetical protein
MPMLAQTPAPQVAGTWTLSGEVQGVPVAETCDLVQTAEGKITGSCQTNTGKYDTTGEVKEKSITFVHGGKYEGTELTMTYTGTLGTDGAVTGTLDVAPFSVTGSFTAKKAAPAAP